MNSLTRLDRAESMFPELLRRWAGPMPSSAKMDNGVLRLILPKRQGAGDSEQLIIQ